MKILLISLQSDLDTIGIKYLHYYLLRHKHLSSLLYVRNFDPQNSTLLKEIRKFVSTTNPDLIGVSLMSTEYDAACELTQYLKHVAVLTPVVWGGIHPSIQPQECLAYADYVCVGEGEKALLEMANALSTNKDVSGIHNLCYVRHGKVTQNPLYPLIVDLNVLPSYDHIPVHSFVQEGGRILPLDEARFRKYARFAGKIYSAIATRGCPFHCSFCCNNVISRLYGNNKVRRRSVSHLTEELTNAVKNNPRVEYINFHDDCFLCCSDEYLGEFCTVYKEKVGKPFIIRTLPAYVSAERMAFLKDAGLSWISLGLQSGSDRVCKEIYQRNSLQADFLRAAKIIKNSGIAAFYDVILDNPFEKEEDALETIKTLGLTPRPFFTQFLSLTLYPGTALYEKAQKEFPGYLPEYCHKNYLKPRKTVINNLIILSTLISPKYMSLLLRVYKQNPQSIVFRILLFASNAVSILILIPHTCVRQVLLSQKGSIWGTIKTFWSYALFYLKTRLRSVLLVSAR